MVVDKPNVQSIVFKEQEGSFLVGLLAAQASKTGKVGFVGGMDIPLIRKFACGYVQGVKYAKKDAEVFQNMTGTTGAAWNDPVKGGELAKSQIDRGADVVYHAAGGTGIGVLRATADAGKLGIGVDSNQNGLHPGKMLTSMVKRVDVATYNAFDQAKKNTFKPGVSVLGLEGGRRRLGARRQQQGAHHAGHEGGRRQGRRGIKSGTIKVHDYMSDSKCPSVMYTGFASADGVPNSIAADCAVRYGLGADFRRTFQPRCRPPFELIGHQQALRAGPRQPAT